MKFFNTIFEIFYQVCVCVEIVFFYYVFVLFKNSCIVMLNKQFGKEFHKIDSTFILNISLQLPDVSKIFNRMFLLIKTDVSKKHL